MFLSFLLDQPIRFFYEDHMDKHKIKPMSETKGGFPVMAETTRKLAASTG